MSNSREAVLKVVDKWREGGLSLEDVLVERKICKRGDVEDYVRFMLAILDQQIVAKEHPSVFLSGNIQISDEQRHLMNKFENKCVAPEIGFDGGGAYVASPVYMIGMLASVLSEDIAGKMYQLLEMENRSVTQWHDLDLKAEEEGWEDWKSGNWPLNS